MDKAKTHPESKRIGLDNLVTAARLSVRILRDSEVKHAAVVLRLDGYLSLQQALPHTDMVTVICTIVNGSFRVTNSTKSSY